MRQLLANGYTPKLRPSGHDISDKFARDNKGSIPPNLLALANTESNGAYQRYCQEHGLPQHPARFPAGIPEHFVRMLTNPGDLVVDPFAGSCVTGEVCQRLAREWICCEIDDRYLEGARARFAGSTQRPTRKGRPLLDGVASQKVPAPYAIHPPCVMVASDDDPIPHDGGRRRPKSATQNGAGATRKNKPAHRSAARARVNGGRIAATSDSFSA
jgi:site-specific DNA-methyltransferase (cytosine-N4-specific)